MDGAKPQQQTVAQALLGTLKAQGIDYVFANAGTDFAPIIESLVRMRGQPTPTFLTVPHENLAVAMAHGYYLVSGKPAAAMVHVTVGTGNTICALMNAYRDNVPLLLMAGRTPHTQVGHIASRSFPIHWGQENFDQAGMVREYTKWDYELRAGQAPEEIVGRALEVAFTEPRGPVYLTLPREVLANVDPVHEPAPPTGQRSSPQPSAEHIGRVAQWIAGASLPVIVTSHLGRNREAAAALAKLADRFAIPVAEAGATCVNLPASHAMNVGQSGRTLLEEADCIVVIDSEVPWFPIKFTPDPTVKVAHLGVDPLWVRYPIRSFPTHLAVPGASSSAVELLADALAGKAVQGVDARRAKLADFKRERAAKTASLCESVATARPISYAYLAQCVREVLPSGGIVVTELGCSVDHLALDEPGSLLGVGIGGGLGFGLGASLGAKLAAGKDRVVISTIGDGSYMFGNPTPFHYVSRAADLPTLTIVCNNNRWHAVEAATRGVYPDGAAAASEVMPLVELKPSPEFTKVAEASDAFALRVDEPEALPDALRAALEAVQSGRQALLDVRMEHGHRSEG